MDHQHKHKTDIAARLMDETGYNRIAIFADEIGNVHYRIKGSDAEIAALFTATMAAEEGFRQLMFAIVENFEAIQKSVNDQQNAVDLVNNIINKPKDE